MDALIVILVFILFIGIIGLIFYLSNKYQKSQAEKVHNQCIDLAEKLGLNCLPPNYGFFQLDYPQIIGSLQGYDYHLHSYLTGGKNKVRYTQVVIYNANAAGKRFKIAPKNFFNSIGKSLGLQDVQTQNELFDINFIVKSNDENWTANLVDTTLADLCMELKDEMKSSVFFKNDRLLYDFIGSIKNEETKMHVQKMTMLLYLIAQRIDETPAE